MAEVGAPKLGILQGSTVVEIIDKWENPPKSRKCLDIKEYLSNSFQENANKQLLVILENWNWGKGISQVCICTASPRSTLFQWRYAFAVRSCRWVTTWLIWDGPHTSEDSTDFCVHWIGKLNRGVLCITPLLFSQIDYSLQFPDGRVVLLLYKLDREVSSRGFELALLTMKVLMCERGSVAAESIYFNYTFLSWEYIYMVASRPAGSTWSVL